jgi:hypothetical protein
MSKLERWLTLVANLSVVAGIVFLAAEMRQNTQAIQAQTRDSMTEKQMQWMEWIGTNPASAEVWERGNFQGLASLTEPGERAMFTVLFQGHLREWENSLYQFERGLYTEEEFVPRTQVWRDMIVSPGYLEAWAIYRNRFAPSFRAEIDRIVAEVEQAQ